MIRLVDDFDKEFGDLLRSRREAVGISRALLAARTGVSDKAIGMWERGEASPTLRNAAVVCAALGLSLPSVIPPVASATSDDYFADFMANRPNRGAA